MPSIRDVERYIGRRYDADSFDCADLAVLIQDELFGRHVQLPGGRGRRQAPTATLERYRADLATEISRDEIEPGDVLLMKGEVLHIGTLFFVGGCWRVLHNSYRLGGVWLHKLSELSSYGLRVEGFYRWKF